MEYPWCSTPQNGSLCPVCSNPHYPFCPPLPPQYYRHTPPHPNQFLHSPLPPHPPPTQPPLLMRPPQQPAYDPFLDHQGGPSISLHPPPAHIPPQPWKVNPNYVKDFSGNSNPGSVYENSSSIGAKRMRLNDVSESYAGSLSEDERRLKLKLIRDHGAASHRLNGNDYVRYSNQGHSFDHNSGDKLRSFADHYQGIESGYRQEIQNYGERAYKHIENDENVELWRSPYNQSGSNVVLNNGYNIHEGDRYKSFEPPTFRGQLNDVNTESSEFKNHFSRTHSAHQHIMEPEFGHYGLPNRAHPPPPTSPPPPLPSELPRSRYSSSASGPGSFPVDVGSASHFQSSYTMVSDAVTTVSTHSASIAHSSSSGYYPTERAVKMAPPNSVNLESENSSRDFSLRKPKVVDVSHILKHPYRANRPDHIVVILRGLPGSGKSYLAKTLRDLEVENGGSAPRIHSMDEYFMTEVEKVEESEGSRSSGSVRGRKPVMKKVMEYCYEPEMEEVYRSSMLKAFKKTIDEGEFPFVIVDDRNLRVADFAQFWAIAKRSGYDVYLLEAAYKDPAGCAARNVHGFTQNEIHKMASQWEEAPSLYTKLDMKSLLHGDDLEENGIEEVDMDTEDGSEGTTLEQIARPSDGDLAVPSENEGGRDDEEGHPHDVVKELRNSKWSNDLDEDHKPHKIEATKGNSKTPSSLIKTHSNKGKSVRWADQVVCVSLTAIAINLTVQNLEDIHDMPSLDHIGRIGFSISSGKAANVSLVIGAGSGYNLKSNPLPEEEKLSQRSGSLRRNIFQEQLRVEHESFRAVFDKRKQRISGLGVDEE